MSQGRPLCTCGINPACARVALYGESEAQFLCADCTVNAVRAANARGELIDMSSFIHVGDRVEGPLPPDATSPEIVVTEQPSDVRSFLDAEGT